MPDLVAACLPSLPSTRSIHYERASEPTARFTPDRMIASAILLPLVPSGLHGPIQSEQRFGTIPERF